MNLSPDQLFVIVLSVISQCILLFVVENPGKVLGIKAIKFATIITFVHLASVGFFSSSKEQFIQRLLIADYTLLGSNLYIICLPTFVYGLRGIITGKKS